MIAGKKVVVMPATNAERTLERRRSKRWNSRPSDDASQDRTLSLAQGLPKVVAGPASSRWEEEPAYRREPAIERPARTHPDRPRRGALPVEPRDDLNDPRQVIARELSHLVVVED